MKASKYLKINNLPCCCLGWGAVLTILLACTSPSSETMIQQQPTTTVTTDKSLSYLALGDSYTIGESVKVEERWSFQLAELINKTGTGMSKPDVIARTGWTTAELKEGIAASGLSRTYDLVSLLIGVNNQYRGQSMEVYRQEFRELLDVAKRFAKGNVKRVFVLSIPDWGITPFAASRDRQQIAQQIDAFNAIAKEECGKVGVLYVDITPTSRMGFNDPSMVAEDHLHFSGKMYGLWAEKALPEVRKLL